MVNGGEHRGAGDGEWLTSTFAFPSSFFQLGGMTISRNPSASHASSVG